MTFARSDSKTIAACLEAMKDLVIARGGFVHPAAAIEERDGMLRAVCHAPGDAGTPLFKVPECLLVPTDDLCWSESDEVFELEKWPWDHNADHRQMLDLFLTIYNATGKMAWFRHQAAHVLPRDPELSAQIALLNRFFPLGAATPAAAFIRTRVFSSSHLAGQNCLMPLIDFLNHHNRGSKYWHDSGQLIANKEHPTGTDECFGDYGKFRDPLGLALDHGYLDLHCPVAQSVGASLNFAEFGLVEIAGKHFASHHRADLPKVEFLEDGLRLSHLAGDVRNPHHVHATLRLVMTASGKRRGIAQSAIERAIAGFAEALLAVNRDNLTAFRKYLATRPELPLAGLLSEACQLQFTNLEKILSG